jgi:hypothetical protein
VTAVTGATGEAAATVAPAIEIGIATADESGIAIRNARRRVQARS